MGVLTPRLSVRPDLSLAAGGNPSGSSGRGKDSVWGPTLRPRGPAGFDGVGDEISLGPCAATPDPLRPPSPFSSHQLAAPVVSPARPAHNLWGRLRDAP